MEENEVTVAGVEDVMPAAEQEPEGNHQADENSDGGCESVDAAEAGADVARLVAEAEERGYVRGRNEAIAEAMKRRGVWEGPSAQSGSGSARSRPVVLSNVRRSVWDM